ncbi:MAG: hypothetical protein NWE83_04410 [Candidatus Bathyarchaeota archaeon]|nr:hypothetical protein [Candidatus Bathyarchaeota archaeon]
MKTKLKVTLILLMLFASILALNTAITPILAKDTCPTEPTCPDVTECETCTELSVMLLDVHLMLKPDPMRWEGSLTFPDGTEFLQTNYVDANAYFVGPEVAWPRNRTQGELEIFREEKEFRDAGGNLVATGFEQGLFNLTSMEWNAFGEFECMTEDFPLWGLEIVKTWVTGMVWIDDCDGWHAEGIVTVLYCDGPVASGCDATEVILAESHLIFMGEGVSGTGPLRWEGTVTFADDTELTLIAYADPAPYFVGPDADWSLFGGGMQGELEIFREEIEWKNQCGDVVVTGNEQGIFNINTFEFNVKGDLTISGDAGPLMGKQIKKFFGTGEVWIDDCGAYHADACNVYLVCDAEPTCPAESTCPEEPACPAECPEEPTCPTECPEEPTCPPEPTSCLGTCGETSVIMANAHLILMGEPVGGTGPFRWEGTLTFADGTVLTMINLVDPSPYFTGPEADWSAFGGGMQGELEIFREEITMKNKCGDVVATGFEQGIFNVTSSEYNVSGELEVCGEAGPLTDKLVEKMFFTGIVWFDDCSRMHAESQGLILVCDA